MKNYSDGRFDYVKLSPQERKVKKNILKKEVRQIKIIPSTTIAELVSDMADMSIQARNIGQCAKVLENMYEDKKRPTVFLGLAGPLIAAGLRRVIRDLIVANAVDVVVSTGAKIVYFPEHLLIGICVVYPVYPQIMKHRIVGTRNPFKMAVSQRVINILKNYCPC